MLAGISTEYYLRLEQGRDRHPSPQVLDALARALMLDEDAVGYLHQLGRPPQRRAARRRPERLSPGLRQLVMSHTDMPAFVQGRYMDVLVANPLATALYAWHAQGTNLLQEAFLNPEVRALYGDEWEHLVSGMVASVVPWPAPRTGTRTWQHWSVSCRSAAASSAACGRATRSNPAPAARPSCTTRRSAHSNSGTKNSP